MLKTPRRSAAHVPPARERRCRPNGASGDFSTLLALGQGHVDVDDTLAARASRRRRRADGPAAPRPGRSSCRRSAFDVDEHVAALQAAVLGRGVGHDPLDEHPAAGLGPVGEPSIPSQTWCTVPSAMSASATDHAASIGVA